MSTGPVAGAAGTADQSASLGKKRAQDAVDGEEDPEGKAKAILKKYRVSARDDIVVTRIKCAPPAESSSTRPSLLNPFVPSSCPARLQTQSSAAGAVEDAEVEKNAQLAALKARMAHLQAVVKKGRSELGFSSPDTINRPKKVKKGRYYSAES
jgi:hypothetical protein